MHRVRATNPLERRLQRLATPTPDDNRISYGLPMARAGGYSLPGDRRARPGPGSCHGLAASTPETGLSP
jgi:hypothetical protein